MMAVAGRWIELVLSLITGTGDWKLSYFKNSCQFSVISFQRNFANAVSTLNNS